jgi:hypothetical protein
VPYRNRGIRVPALLASLFLAACGGSEPTDPGGNNGGQTPSISLAVGSPTLTLAQGGTGQVAVTITRSGGFTGAVTVSVEGLPAGITAQPLSLGSTQTSGVLQVVAAGTATAGSAALTVRATGTGVSAQTATVALTVTASVSGSYTLSVAPTPLAVAPGASGNATVTVARTGGFQGAVALTATAPNGVTVTFTPASVTGAEATAAVTVAAGTAAGNYAVVIRGASPGLADQTANLQVSVAAAAGFSLSVAPTPLAVNAGAAANATVTIARAGGFAGTVNLTATVPAGLTAAFNPAAVTGTTSTLQVSAGAGAAGGNYTVTIRGNATGLGEQTAQLTVAVSAAPPGSGNVSWNFCPASGVPLWVAAQDGSGAWTRVTGSNNAYSFQINSGRGGVAYVLPWQTGGFDVEVFYGTTAELQTRGGEICAVAGALKTVNGSVAGNGLTDMTQVTLGSSIATIAAGSPNTFSLTNVIPGSLDLLASRSAMTINGTSVGFTPNRFVLRRGLNPANGSTLPVIDFGTEGFAPQSATTTIANLGADQALQVMSYTTANNTFGTLYVDGAPAAATSRPVWGIPAAQQVAGDFHFLNVNASPAGLTGVPAYTRNVGLVFQAVSNRTVTLGPLHSAVTIGTAAGAGYGRITATFAIQPEYDRYHVADYQQAGGGAERRTQVQKTKGYIAAGGASDLNVPDLSGVTGWLADWGLKLGVSAVWTVASSGWTDPGGIFITPFMDGAVYTSATRGGTITP